MTATKTYKLGDIINFLPADTLVLTNNASEERYFDNIKPTGLANPTSLVFIDHNRNDKQQLAENTQASFLICDPSVMMTEPLKNKVVVQVGQPKLIFSTIANHLIVPKPQWGIHPSAVIDSAAQIHPNVFIGAHCHIGACVIEEGTIIYPNAYVHDDTKIGKNVIVYAGAVIGMEGYGYNRDASGFPTQFPHVGGVVLADFSEIGANSAIDRGTMGDTVIGYGSKIDNLVHIGHNVRVGKHVYIAAQTSVAGSTVIGDNCSIWTGVSIADGLSIGSNAYIGMGSVVIQNIPEGKKAFGNPARVFGNNE